jgi:hypothetical protein
MYLTADIMHGMPPARHIQESPYFDIVVGLVILVLGILMFIYRQQIGDFSVHAVNRGRIIDRPTPGFLLIPFAIALIICGSMVIINSIQVLLAG